MLRYYFMSKIEETAEWLIAIINPLSVNRCYPATQELLRITINQNTNFGKAFQKWDMKFQLEVMQLDLDIVKFFYKNGFMDKVTLMKGRDEVKEWIKLDFA